MQRNWIGRSEGAEVDFERSHGRGARRSSIRVFTTRPDTLFGATYMVLAARAPAGRSRSPPPSSVAAVQAVSPRRASKSDLDAHARTPRRRPACSPAPTRSTRSTARRIPIWIADYVLMGYGTGAIMAVPAHDSATSSSRTQFDSRPRGRDARRVAGERAPLESDGHAALPARRRLSFARRSRRGVASTVRADLARRPAHAPRPSGRSPTGSKPKGLGQRHGQLQAARLALQPAALLGRAVPHPARARRRDPSGRRGGAAGRAAGDGGLPPGRERRSRRPAASAAGPGARVVAAHVGRIDGVR